MEWWRERGRAIGRGRRRREGLSDCSAARSRVPERVI